MAELARQLGFRFKEIDMIIDSSPDHQIARTALLQAGKPSRYRYNDEQFNILVRRIVNSAMTLQVRSGTPQIRTHEQDSPLLFLDRMNADIPAADTITGFYVRRCVFFAFFGKPSRSNNTNQDREADEGQRMRDPPQSALFFQENGKDHPRYISNPRGGGLSGKRYSVGEIQKNKRRLLASYRTDEKDRDSMELETPPSETLDQDIADQSNTFSGGDRLAALPNERVSSELAIVPIHARHGSFHTQAEDGMSDCTRVSFEAISREESPVGRAVSTVIDRESGFQDQRRINNTSGASSVGPEDDTLSDSGEHDRGQGMDMYIADLRRATEEEERSEEV
ncbi:hypothetical protein N7456_006884 [Penicillium angulare]|uniref:Uncharacterized protein n=1 Tax=Penicillium angulare TaxID=116970 RepID=A0A9W9KDB0_9EURO|nr:hypothetical protein N7456_006884 [Penicillium angulare]